MTIAHHFANAIDLSEASNHNQRATWRFCHCMHTDGGWPGILLIQNGDEAFTMRTTGECAVFTRNPANGLVAVTSKLFEGMYMANLAPATLALARVALKYEMTMSWIECEPIQAWLSRLPDSEDLTHKVDPTDPVWLAAIERHFK